MLNGSRASQRIDPNGSTVRMVAPSSVSHPASLLPQESTDFGTASANKRAFDRKLSLSNLSYEESFPIKQTFSTDPSLASNSRVSCRVSYTKDVTSMDRPPGVIRIDTRNHDGGSKLARTSDKILNPKRGIEPYRSVEQRYPVVRSNDNQKLKNTILLPESPDSSSITPIPFPPPPLKFTQIQSTCEGASSAQPLMRDANRHQSSTAFGGDGTKHIFPKSAMRKSHLGFDGNTDPSFLGTLQYDQSRIGRVEIKADTGSQNKSAIPPSYQDSVKNNIQTAPTNKKDDDFDIEKKDNATSPDLENIKNLAKTPLSKWRNKTPLPKPKPLYVILLLTFLLVLAVALLIYFATDKRGNANGRKMTPTLSTNDPVLSSTRARMYSTTLGDSRCLTDDCIKIAADIIGKMNQTADPCEDFYEYACGGWMRSNYIPPDKTDYGIRSQMEERNKQTLYQALIRPNECDETAQNLGGNYANLSAAEKTAKVFFKSCTDTQTIEYLGAQPLLNAINNTGGWFALGNWNQGNWNFHSMLNMLHGEQNVFAFFKTGLIEETSNELAIGPGGLTLPDRMFYVSDQMEMGISRLLGIYERFIKKVLRLLQATNVNDTFDDIYKVEKDLAQVMENSTKIKIDRPATIKELTTICPKVNWRRLIAKLKGKRQDDNSVVFVYSINYLKQLQAYLSASDPRALHNYMVWRLVLSRMEFLSRNFQETRKNFYSYVLGEAPSKPLWERCMGDVNSYLKWAAAALFVRQTVNADVTNQVEEMVRNIQGAFKENLRSVQWMDKATKRFANEKLEAMKYEVAYPKDLLSDKNFLQNMYNYQLDESTYFDNMVTLIKGNLRQVLDNAFGTKPAVSWMSLPHTMHAYYSPRKNRVAFPAGLLQPPFFSLAYPSSLNYGGLGFIIGHELSHAFDEIGQRVDKYGDLNPWWSRSTGEKFLAKSDCVVTAYKKYRIGSNFVRGDLTLHENIGDMAGLKLSYMAYKKYIQNNPRATKNLPVSSLTDDKQFFLGYAQTWCIKRLPQSYIQQLLDSQHAPAKFRVLGVVTNNKDFAKAYDCPKGTPMNPTKKCSVW